MGCRPRLSIRRGPGRSRLAVAWTRNERAGILKLGRFAGRGPVIEQRVHNLFRRPPPFPAQLTAQTDDSVCALQRLELVTWGRARECGLLVTHEFGNALEKRGRKVALAGVG